MFEELRKVEVLDDDFSDRYIIWEYKGFKIIESGCKDDEGFYKYDCTIKYNDDDVERFKDLNKCCEYIDNIALNVFKEIREDTERRIKTCCNWINGVGHLEPHFAIVEKSLKAIEIIKKKEVDIDHLRDLYFNDEYEKYDLEYYNTRGNKPLTQEEYDLLKEVFR